MPDHIHTIPILDALRDPKHCAFCVMRSKVEGDAIRFIMSPAYMEDDVRMETNKLGFCETHLVAMYNAQNRLGLALMLHTHIRKLSKDISSKVNSKLPAPFFGKDTSGPIATMRAHLDKTLATCYVCNSVESTFARYLGTFLYMWGKGGEDARLIKSQKGYCLPHFTMLLAEAENLSRSKRDKFMEEIARPQLAHMKELEENLEWFTLKFDHRNANEPWKNAKDALPRALALMGVKEGATT